MKTLNKGFWNTKTIDGILYARKDTLKDGVKSYKEAINETRSKFKKAALRKQLKEFKKEHVNNNEWMAINQ